MELLMPEPDSQSGWVKTLNNMGFMTSHLDSYSQAFVDFASSAPGPVLDIGAAYGVATLAALEAGASVIANDLEEKHLRILKAHTPPHLRPRLTLNASSMPYELDFPAQSIGAVLICRVLHFFEGREIEMAAYKIFQWLAPGGRVFVITETPYVGTMKKFIPIYEGRKTFGTKWPGIVNVGEIDFNLLTSLPEHMHLLDPEVLTRVFRDEGFEILKAETFPRPDFPKHLQLDGRESVGLIAQKPAP